ncbi:DNA-protecting protein DprA [Porphyromonas gingivalis]|uniref:DNA-processing protein DprA n=1 Tax=Porphyromonas TaxID=836 RepID=UPI001F162E46|nr:MULTISPECIES: DNA-processing protein DprA [Porphyromonas]MCE8191024.1 DNA-protecting protein DprA [Porphyromonas gingivalis]
MEKGLTKELLATLSCLKGFGPKSILKIAEGAEGIETPKDLYKYMSTLSDKKIQNVTLQDILGGYEEVLYLLEKSEDEGISLMGYYDAEFPRILHDCIDENGKITPPLLLYYRGNLELLKLPGLAIIGTREPTDNGILAGRFFSENLAKRGFNIISGLAIGCDTSAHEGALLAGGATTAFLAHGLNWDSIYPRENLELAERIVESGGLLLSEYSIGEKVNRYNLVARDRLQAGLAKGTIVIQTGERGGTMHAVNATIKAEKPLYAVEYSKAEDLVHEKTQGNLMLIKTEKAAPINSKNIDSVVNELLKVPLEKYEQQRLF